ncbi:hypothetical protein scyTo_0003845 [Scyliorhinus torazame]|uniref:Uncharacterized protein n=1 Tax=Scyliorhinus torazame TaxID=75743 RepID=A0A401PNQ7_SCYTO|nr:hypothetical protein [Scyliorhinus torazame]
MEEEDGRLRSLQRSGANENEYAEYNDEEDTVEEAEDAAEDEEDTNEEEQDTVEDIQPWVKLALEVTWELLTGVTSQTVVHAY